MPQIQPFPTPKTTERWAGWFWGFAIVAGIGALSYVNFLLFHAIAEAFFIIVACGIFIVAWHCRHWIEDRYLVCIGLGYLFVAALHLLHTLSYKGIVVFPETTANLPTQLWIASRYLEGGNLLAGFWLARRRISFTAVLYGYTLVCGLLLLAIFTGVFPDCFVEGASPPLTLFKRASEFAVILLLAGVLLMLARRPGMFAAPVRRLLMAALALSMLAGLAFTFYVSVYGLSNLTGHLAQILASYLIYKALVETGLLRPHELFYHNLKQSEAALRQSNAELADRTRELESFALHVAHDLKSPLAAVRGLTELAVTETTPNQGALRELLQMAVESSDRMNDLITGLLQLARIGHQPLELTEVDLTRNARQVLLTLQAAEPERQVTVVLPPMLTVRGDAKALHLVLQNLLGNAWKFTRQQAHPRIELRCRNEGEATEIGVCDNGIGFDPQQGGRLFRAFERLHPETGFAGHGLGLASVRKIVERHGGRVWAEGHPGEGASFWFSLKVG